MEEIESNIMNCKEKGEKKWLDILKMYGKAQK